MNNPRLLLLLLAAAGLVAFYQWQDGGGFFGLSSGTDTATAPAPRPVQAGTPAGGGAPVVNPLHGLSVAQLAQIADRPLFNPTRAPRPAPEMTAVTTEPETTDAPSTPTAPEVNPADYQLLAVAGSNSGRVAVVRFAPDNRIYHVRQGQYLADWLVEAVSDRSVKLSRDEKNFEIAMFKPPAPADGGSAVAPDSGGDQLPPDAAQDGGDGSPQ